MSHFAVLVITDQEPTDAVLSEVMQPWHEYECTGVRDQYVVPVDRTDEVMEEFNSPVKVVVMSDGQVLDRYDDLLYASVPDEVGGRPIGTKKEFRLPDQATEVEMPAVEARTHGLGYATMEECAKEYFGIDEGDHNPEGEPGHIYQWSNPNKKWDWWVVGGRWSGALAPKYDPSEDPANKETCWLCRGTGTRCDSITENKPMRCNGCQGTGVRVKFSSEWKKVRQDRCQVKDLDLEALRSGAEQKALAEWERWQPVVAGRPVPSWEELRQQHIKESSDGRDWDAVRKLFNEDPVVLAIKEAAGNDYIWDMPALCDRLRMTREDRAAKARRDAPVLFGYVKDGRWVERGSMGWFASVSDEEDPEVWSKHYNEVLESLRPDQWVTVVDCHI